MASRLIILAAILLAWLPAVFLYFNTGSNFALMLPVMGFYPCSVRSGDPSYSESAMYMSSIVFFILFATLGVFAFQRKSKSLSGVFAVLLITSTLIVTFRFLTMLGEL